MVRTRGLVDQSVNHSIHRKILHKVVPCPLPQPSVGARSTSLPVSRLRVMKLRRVFIGNLWKRHVTRRCWLFKEGITDTHDEERRWRPSNFPNDIAAKIEETILEDHRLMLDHLLELFQHIS
ncbi:hypothetical protein J437_LFUL019541 [Ladona fulva]|uniref:Uncharacterized protein n=1 Tax=Ladona fulva TaxID=123851 RepID=A0A8K0PAH0_LADFU|nr:hypothetical protein J437_LFUL019541 [Ladona fulva]